MHLIIIICKRLPHQNPIIPPPIAQKYLSLHLLATCLGCNLLLLARLGAELFFNRLEPAEIEPGEKEDEGEIEDAKAEENAEPGPSSGVEDVE